MSTYLRERLGDVWKEGRGAPYDRRLKPPTSEPTHTYWPLGWRSSGLSTGLPSTVYSLKYQVPMNLQEQSEGREMLQAEWININEWVNEWCFRPQCCTIRLSWAAGNLGLMGWFFMWMMPQVLDWSLNLLTCSPVYYLCVMLISVFVCLFVCYQFGCFSNVCWSNVWVFDCIYSTSWEDKRRLCGNSCYIQNLSWTVTYIS